MPILKQLRKTEKHQNERSCTSLNLWIKSHITGVFSGQKWKAKQILIYKLFGVPEGCAPDLNWLFKLLERKETEPTQITIKGEH